MKSYYFIIFALLIFVGCENSDNKPPISNEISINAVHPNVVSRATATAFEEGDKIGLYAVEYEGEEPLPFQIGGNFLNNEGLNYTGGVWTPKRTLYWSDKPLNFHAYYPYVEVTSINEHVFDLATDQRTVGTADVLGGYEASDFLYAKATKISRADGAVNLAFDHLMSKVLVKVTKGATFEGELPADITVSIYNTTATASINLETGSASEYRYGKKRIIKAKQVDANTFEAIVVPQYIDLLTPLVEIVMEDISYLLSYSISFRPGMIHTLEVIVNTSPDQEKIEISIDGTINDWS